MVLPSGQVTRRDSPVDDEVGDVEPLSGLRTQLASGAPRTRCRRATPCPRPAAHEELGVHVPGVEQAIPRQQPLGRQRRIESARSGRRPKPPPAMVSTFFVIEVILVVLARLGEVDLVAGPGLIFLAVAERRPGVVRRVDPLPRRAAG